MIKISSGVPRESLQQSSAIFVNLRNHTTFGQILENHQKYSESGQKCSENRQLRHHQYVCIIPSTFYNKKNITCQLEDMNFMLSWQEQYHACSLRSLLRYCSSHSNKKFISSRYCVISSISGAHFSFFKPGGLNIFSHLDLGVGGSCPSLT